MASCSCTCSSVAVFLLSATVLLLVIEVESCYTSIFNFGDSLSDTGNLLYDDQVTNTANYFSRFPYGETFFHHPTGRFSDGRLIIDFIAEAFELPFLPPYLGRNVSNFHKGVNFAVAGATALDGSFFTERGIHSPTSYTLGVQVGWFKQLLPSLCDSFSSNKEDCQNAFKRSLFMVGEIGGNDYNHPFFQGKSFTEIKAFVPHVIETISAAINMLIEEGATTLMVPGNFPIGCLSVYLTKFMSSNEDDYDAQTGCLKWLNKFANYHNELLQKELEKLQRLHPHATIIYADHYNAALDFYRSRGQLGSKGEALKACCGGGGPYNYNSSATCGAVGSNVCEDPSLYVCWDGLHLTEAAYKSIATSVLSSSSLSNLLTTTTTAISTSNGENLL